MKSLAKKALEFGPLDRKLRSHFKFELGSELVSALVEDNFWLLSQMKSGTTFFCNAVAFYHALKLGVPQPSFDDTAAYGVGRNLYDNFGELRGITRFARETGKRWIIQTHESVPARPAQLVLLSRDPLDYCVSSYFFHFKNRKGKENTRVEAALNQIVDKFAALYHQQREEARRNTQVHVLMYEDLMRAPVDEIGRIVFALYGEIDLDLMSSAVQLAGVDRLKSHEKDTGRAIIGQEGAFKAAHFVRSGKIGEGRDFFDGEQIALIEKRLGEAGVPLSGRLG